ncbi:uncharacterized protein B0I36DRAFT_331478 [Microdochium trichocladiopsis]|uniref:Uncharacterized protein n=1 Tax=Microdochium trichocladiopsis TaxID=1682393 RepID=A0A9P8Y091_9PEZI|nr:uncharacterized protein B0I36DRAFT_331478 [Microdochium trichocladiopsis]KAH7024471.1 hypothetical protein B0I36DRAFT_331478 [Microdochium trichocladiopsis]
MISIASRMRSATRTLLAAVAVLCTLFTGLSLLATLMAGTLQMDGDYPDGVGYLVFPSLAPVHFYGILPSPEESDSGTVIDDSNNINNNNDSGEPTSPSAVSAPATTTAYYQIKISFFLNSLAFSWPASPRWSPSTGIIRNIDGLWSAAYAHFPSDLALVARRMGLPEDDYACLLAPETRAGIWGWSSIWSSSRRSLPPRSRMPCTNDFLLAWWRHANTYTTSTGQLVPRRTVNSKRFNNLFPLLAYYAAGMVLVAVVVTQVYMLSYAPGDLANTTKKKKKNNNSSKETATEERKADECPDGRQRIQAESEMGPGARSRRRLSGLAVLGGVYGFAVLVLGVQAWRVKRLVDGVESDAAAVPDCAGGMRAGFLGGGMHAEIGEGFVVLSLWTLLAICVAWVSLWAREKLRVKPDDHQGYMLIPRQDGDMVGKLDGEGDESGCEEEREAKETEEEGSL